MPQFSGFWGSNYTLPTGNPDLARIRKMMAKPGNRATAARLQALIGAAAGGTATRQRRRIKHSSEQSGKIGVELVTEINRATTAADVTELKKMTLPITSRPTYPGDKGKNGGPALA